MPTRDINRRPVSVYVTYEELFGEPYRLADLKELTAKLPPEDAANWLCAQGAALDLTPWPAPQADMARYFLQPRSVADKAISLMRSGRRDGWLHAGVIAAGWRALAVWGQVGQRPLREVERELTRWTFLLSSAYSQAQAEVFRDGQPMDADDRLLTDIAFTLQNEWVHLDYVDFYSLARQYALLFHIPHMAGSSPTPILDLEALSPEVLGVPLLDYMALGVILFAWFSTRAGRSEPLEEKARAGFVDLCNAIRPTRLDIGTARTIIQGASQTLAELAGRCDRGHSDDGWYQSDWLRLRQWPLIRHGATDRFASALPRLVTEALSLGIYYRFFNHFLHAEARADNAFSAYWGKLVEFYTGRLLSDGLSKERTGHRRVWLPGDLHGTERCDGVLFYPGRAGTAIVIESTSSHFTVRSLSGRDLLALRADLDRIVVQKLSQLSKACDDLYAGRTLIPASDAREPQRPERFIPVLVTWQSVPVWEPLMRFIDAACKQHGFFSDVPHLPVQVMTMEELELLLDSGRSVLFELRQRAQHPTGRNRPMRNWFYAHGIAPDPSKRVPLLTEAFRDLEAKVMRRLSGSGEAAHPLN